MLTYNKLTIKNPLNAPAFLCYSISSYLGYDCFKNGGNNTATFD